MMQAIRDLLRITGYGKQFLILLLLRCPFDTFRTILQASFLQFSFMAILQNDIRGLLRTCIIFGVGNLLLFLYNGTVWMAYASISIRIIRKLREKLFHHISKLPLKQVEKLSVGEWQTRLNADVLQATALINQPLHIPHAAVAIVEIIVSAIFLLVMNKIIFVLVILFLIPHIALNYYVIARPITNLSKKSLEITAHNTFCMNAIITGADIMILYDAKEFMLDKFYESSLALKKANMRIQVRRALADGILPLLGLGGYLAILLIGGIYIRNDSMCFPKLLAIFQYRGGIIIATMMITNCFLSIKSAVAGVNRVKETMNK